MTYQNDPTPGTRASADGGPATGPVGGPQPGAKGGAGSMYALVGAAIIAALVVVAFMVGAFDGGSTGGSPGGSGANIPNASPTNPSPRTEQQPASPGTSGPQTNPAPVR